jgi:putative transposase
VAPVIRAYRFLLRPTRRQGIGLTAMILSCADVPARPLPATGQAVGIDMGTVEFLATSDGRRVPAPEFAAKAADRIADAQRELARKQRGSNRRRKAAKRVGALYAKVARQRRDFAHNLAGELVGAYDAVFHEELQIENLTRRAKPKPDPQTPGGFLPNGQAAKAALAGKILDAAWGVYFAILNVKAECAGRLVDDVPAPYTSQTCAACGHVDPASRVTRAEFRCTRCGHRDHADVNAARNILRAGLARQADTTAA